MVDDGMDLFSYNAPYTWVIAILLVYAFSRIRNLPNWLTHILAFVTPSIFGIYLFHDTTIFGREMVKTIQAMLSAYLCNNAYFVAIISSVLVFLLSLGVDLFHRLFMFSFSAIIRTSKKGNRLWATYR